MPQMIPGVSLTLGAETYVVPALSARQYKQHRSAFKDLSSGSDDLSDDQLDRVVAMVHSAVQRNYPAVTLEQIWDQVDLRNLRQVVHAIAGQSGLEATGAQQGGSGGGALDWDELISHVSASLGVPPREAWDMCLPDLWSLLDYWRKHPPVHLLVASYLGYKPPDPIQIAAANERAVTRVSATEFDRICADLDLPPMPTLTSFPSP